MVTYLQQLNNSNKMNAYFWLTNSIIFCTSSMSIHF